MPQDRPIRFDSSAADANGASWSRIAGRFKQVLRCDPPFACTKLTDATGATMREWSNPLDALQWLGAAVRHDEWIGWLSYDLGRWFEKLPSIAIDDLNLPLFVFTAHDPASLRSDPCRDTGVSPVRNTTRTGQTPVSQVAFHALSARHGHARPGLQSTFTREQYERAVQRVIDYIAAGDVFQVNLSQRFTAPLARAPSEIYDRLRAQSPATHGALLDYGDFALICNSPELFLRVTPNRRIITRPIKGTRPRAPGMEAELLHSAKDQAELNMIVDLERNDLGRVCEIGSVRVTEPRIIESHPTVYHGVATIEGTLRSDVTFLDLLRATFPGGSVTGAPKIRAMEIIDQLEPVRRGPYCGAIGYLSPDGTIELNIAIRTMIAKDGLIHIPVGGGIVADSDPEAEYEETLVKAQAMFAALGIVGEARNPKLEIRNKSE